MLIVVSGGGCIALPCGHKEVPVTHLRKLMLEDLERRNYAASTTRAYLQAVDEFARYFNRPPNQLGPDHIRQYQAYLFRERKLHPNTVIQHLGGIRFFY